MRLSFKGHSSIQGQITGASIGSKKASSDAWDFTSTPTNITFNGGSDSGTLPAGGTLVSDEINFTFDSNTDYLVAIYSTDGRMGYLSMSNAAFRRDGLGSDDSMTVDASNYGSEPYIEWLSKIEVYTETSSGGGEGTEVTYEYDANGDRVYKMLASPGKEIYYSFNGLDVAYEEEITLEGTTKRYYIHALGRNIAMTEVDDSYTGGTGGEWATAWDAQIVSGDSSWGDYTAVGRNSRVIVLSADTIAEGSKVRLSFKGHSSIQGQITGASIGSKKASSDAWDFTSTPTNITFNGGSDSGTLPAGGTLVSDEINYDFNASIDYLVAIYSHDGDMGYLSMSNAAYRRDGLGSDDSMTVDASNYGSEPYIEWLSKIEVYTETSSGGSGMETYFYHTDYLGSVRMISDVTGDIVWQKRYEPFGGDEAQSGTIENTYQFTGKGWDEDAQLFYFNARWYDADIGRFISEDPLWGSIFDPQSLNRFAYARNNPYQYTDPTGLEDEDVSWGNTDHDKDPSDPSTYNRPSEEGDGGSKESCNIQVRFNSVSPTAFLHGYLLTYPGYKPGANSWYFRGGPQAASGFPPQLTTNYGPYLPNTPDYNMQSGTQPFMDPITIPKSCDSINDTLGDLMDDIDIRGLYYLGAIQNSNTVWAEGYKSFGGNPAAAIHNNYGWGAPGRNDTLPGYNINDYFNYGGVAP